MKQRKQRIKGLLPAPNIWSTHSKYLSLKQQSLVLRLHQNQLWVLAHTQTMKTNIFHTMASVTHYLLLKSHLKTNKNKKPTSIYIL